MRRNPSLRWFVDTLRHDLTLSGYAFRLRPVEERDADYIVRVRARHARFLNRGETSVPGQLAWLARYFERAGDYYFVIEALHDGAPVGLIGIYNEGAGSAEWGRWILEPGSSAAVESALLIYHCGFDRLGLSEMRCRTLIDNAQVVAFHDSCGLVRSTGTIEIERDGESGFAVEHVLPRAQWPAVEARLARLAARAAQAARRPAVAS